MKCENGGKGILGEESKLWGDIEESSAEGREKKLMADLISQCNVLDTTLCPPLLY